MEGASKVGAWQPSLAQVRDPSPARVRPANTFLEERRGVGYAATWSRAATPFTEEVQYTYKGFTSFSFEVPLRPCQVVPCGTRPTQSVWW